MEVGVLFGLGAALAFGAGDFTGGFAARRAGGIVVAAGANVVGLGALLVLLALLRPAFPAGPAPLLLGGLAGAMGGIGLIALYRGLSMGSMGVVTALSGLGSVLIPLLVGVVFLRQLIAPLQWGGITCALAAGLAASGATRRGIQPAALGLAAVAAIGFGAWFVLLDLAAEGGDEAWVLLASRAAASMLVGGLALLRLWIGWHGGGTVDWRLVALAGTLDVAGNGTFVLSTAAIPLGIAAALSGLYPIVTMLLARVVLREVLPALGVGAVILAVAGVVLISVGG